NLREAREVASLEYEAHVGMRDEKSLLVDNVHVAGGADVDLRDDLPHRTEIHLCRRGLRRAFAPWHRHVERRFRLVAKRHGTEVRTSNAGLHETGIPGQSALAAALVRCEAGDEELYFARRVELNDLVDGRRVTKEAEKVGLTLLACGRSVEEGTLHRRHSRPPDHAYA